MKKYIPSSLILLITCIGLAEEVEVKSKLGKIIKLEIVNIDHQGFTAFQANSTRFNVTWDKVDLDWLKLNQPKLYDEYQKVFKEYEAFKSYNPIPDMAVGIENFLSGMKGSLDEFNQLTSCIFNKTEDGKIQIVKKPYHNKFLQIGGTYDYLMTILSKDTSRSTREEINNQIANLIVYAKEYYDRLSNLPNAKTNKESSAILQDLRNLSNYLEDIKANKELHEATINNIKSIIKTLQAFEEKNRPKIVNNAGQDQKNKKM